jgi:hypothetical protein
MAVRRLSSGSLLGGAVVILGLALLAGTTGIYDAGALLRYVPSLFVAVGLYALWAGRLRNLFGPLLLVGAASAWQLVALGVVTAERALSLWPLVLVIFGLSLVLGRVRSRPAAEDASVAEAVAVFGGTAVRVTSPEFLRASATALFGGAELDLRDAAVPAPPAYVDATALFGGVEVIVPRDWNVRLDVLPVLGGAEDERVRRERTHESVDLVVTGTALFGAVTVTD